MDRLRAALLLSAALPGILSAQETAAKEQESIRVDVDVVNVLCTVRDKQGMLIRDLKQTDFKVSEDGAPQEIRYFAHETNLPLTIALLLDVSGSVRWFVEDEKRTAAKFLEQVIRPDDQALLVGFSST